MKQIFETTTVLGAPYAELNYTQATDVICRWSGESRSRTVVVAPVSSLIMRRRIPKLNLAYDNADMITSDGVPIVWMRRFLGRKKPTRLYGPDLMLSVCRACVQQSISIGLLGGHPSRMSSLVEALLARYPGLDIKMAQSPPFRELTDSEVRLIGKELDEAKCRVLFVGIGCPKQEILMERLRLHTDAVLIGVGAAFDFIPGHVRQAPAFIQRIGLEWAFRLACEPRRLWRRYATTIPVFAWSAMIQIAEDRIAKQLQQTKATR